MLFSGHNNHLEIHINDMGKHQKLLAIKKMPYMTEEYERFIIKGLDTTSVGKELTRVENVKLKKGDQVDDAVGIIINDMRSENEDSIKYLIAQLDFDFCNMKNILSYDETDENKALIEAIEAMVLPELKEITCPVADDPEDDAPADDWDDDWDDGDWDDDLDDWDDWSDDLEDWDDEENLYDSIILGYGAPVSMMCDPDIGELPVPADTPHYLNHFPVCPNLALETLAEMYTDCYREFVARSVVKKLTKQNHAEDKNLTGDLLSMQKLLAVIDKEIKIVSKYRRNCASCVYKSRCKGHH